LKVKHISLRENHTVITDLNNDVWIFGNNNHGQLGVGNHKDRNIPDIKAKCISAGKSHTVLIDMNDDIWTFGCNHSGRLGLGDYIDRTTPKQISNLKAKQVASRVLRARETSAGGCHTVIIDSSSNIFVFGYNEHGQSQCLECA
jgi:alpha-tubulin suppressor-like RCC1 family protein